MIKIKKVIKIIFFINIFIFFGPNQLCAEDVHSQLLKALNSNYPLEMTFKQEYDGNEVTGWMLIAGKGRARTEFSPPNNSLIVADGKWIIFHDPEIDRTTYLPLNSGILQALLNPKSIKKNEDFKVKKIIKNKMLAFSIMFNFEKSEQEVIIYFERDSKVLLGWKILENNNKYINVDVLTNRKVDLKFLKRKNLFKLTEEMRSSGKVYLGPYKRKVLRVPDNGRLN